MARARARHAAGAPGGGPADVRGGLRPHRQRRVRAGRLRREHDDGALPGREVGADELHRSLALALGPHGVTVNAVSPGTVATPLWEGLDGALRDAGPHRRPRCWRSERPTPSRRSAGCRPPRRSPTSCGSSCCPRRARSPARWCRCERAHPPPHEHAGRDAAGGADALGAGRARRRAAPARAPGDGRGRQRRGRDLPRAGGGGPARAGHRRRWPASTRWRSASCRRGWRRSAAATTR